MSGARVEDRGAVTAGVASPYDTPELYDLLLDHLDFDAAYWIEFAKGGRGPALEIGCGSGRVLMRLLAAGVDADGVDASEAMLGRARERAAAAGHRPNLTLGDMRDFTMPRRYTRAICAFNSFGHMETPDDQVRALQCIRRQLEPGGALAIFMSYPGPAYWSHPDGEPVLETEFADPRTGRRYQLWDTRTKDVVGQRQHSRMEIRELDDAGAVKATHVSEITQRWVYRFEMELLFRLAGFERTECFGGFAGEPMTRPDQPLITVGWTA